MKLKAMQKHLNQDLVSKVANSLLKAKVAKKQKKKLKVARSFRN